MIQRTYGPAASLLAHVGLVLLLLSRITMATKQPTDEIEVDYVDPMDMGITLDPTDPAPGEDWTEDNIPDFSIPPPDAEPVVEDLVVNDVIDVNDSPLKMIDMKGANMLLDNAVSDLQLQRKTGSVFGFERNIKGDLVGTMYDLKRDGSRNPRPVDYYTDLRAMVEKRFSKEAMRPYYRVPKQLFLSHLFLPYTKADTGPEAFGVGKLMDPTKWVVHYTGQIQTIMAGRYRFVGEFDDVIIVFVDGKVVLEAGWGERVTDWAPSENVGRHLCFTTHPLVYGEWIELDALREHRIDIVIGENPGGFVGGLLMIQQEGREYAADQKGRPILPIFTTQPLTPEDLVQLSSLPDWKFAENTPIMGVRQELLVSKAQDTNEVTVVIE